MKSREEIIDEIKEIVVEQSGPEELVYYPDEVLNSMADMVLEDPNVYMDKIDYAMIDWWAEQPWNAQFMIEL